MTKGEVDFPRGGVADTGRKSGSRRRAPPSDDLFRVHGSAHEEETVQKPSRKRKKNTPTIVDKEDDLVSKMSIEPITLESLAVGTVVLGCIQKISDYELKLVIPGAIVVTVPIFNISDTYSETVEAFMTASATKGSARPLKPQAMFEPGQCFPVKIMEKEGSPDDHSQMINIVGSLNPKDVYANVISTNVVTFATKLNISAAVTSSEDHGYVMDIGMGDSLRGFLSREDSQAYLKSSPFNKTELAVGQLIACAGVSATGRVVRLTTKTNVLSKNKITGEENIGIISLSTLMPGTRVSMRIMDVSQRGLEVVVANEHKGFVYKDHLKSEWELPKANYSIGDVVDGTVLYKTHATDQIACTLRALPNPASIQDTWAKIHVGHLFEDAVILSRDECSNLILKAGKFKLFAPKNQLSDRFTGSEDALSVESEFPDGSQHKCRVKLVSYIDSFIRVTLKPSITEMNTMTIDDIEVGSLVKGNVVKLTKGGLLLQLGYRLRAFVPTIHLSDTLLTHPEKVFPLNKEVKCRIRKIDTSSEPPRIVATCKKSLLNCKILATFEDGKPDTEAIGVVVICTDNGMLVEFFGAVRGWVPAKFVQMYKATNPTTAYHVGQTLRCWIHSVPEKDRLTLSLRPRGASKPLVKTPSEVTSEAEALEVKDDEPKKQAKRKHSDSETMLDAEESEDEELKPKKTKKEKLKKKKDKKAKKKLLNLAIKEKINDEEQSLQKKGVSKKLVAETSRAKNVADKVGIDDEEAVSQYGTKRLQKGSESDNHEEGVRGSLVPDAFVWDSSDATKALRALRAESERAVAAKVEGEEDKSSGAKDGTRRERRTKQEKNEDARQKEAELRRAETQLADRSRLPESIADYERLVLASPNDSLVWLQYVTFLLEHSEVDKARAAAEKAIKTISFREENEKLNVWFAYLNLEHIYGTSDSLSNLLERALQLNDQMKIYGHMANLFLGAGKSEAAEQVHETLLKKFKQEKSVWINYGLFNMRLKRLESARKLMQRSFASLDKRHHIDVISKFGQMEFNFGEAERGKTLFENMLVNYPKRIDLWLIYIDMLIKYTLKDSVDINAMAQALDSVRTVFERVLSLRLPSKKIKGLFTKYVDFEARYGTESTVQKVNKTFAEYVEANPMLHPLEK